MTLSEQTITYKPSSSTIAHKRGLLDQASRYVSQYSANLVALQDAADTKQAASNSIAGFINERESMPQSVRDYLHEQRNHLLSEISAHVAKAAAVAQARDTKQHEVENLKQEVERLSTAQPITLHYGALETALRVNTPYFKPGSLSLWDHDGHTPKITYTLQRPMLNVDTMFGSIHGQPRKLRLPDIDVTIYLATHAVHLSGSHPLTSSGVVDTTRLAGAMTENINQGYLPPVFAAINEHLTDSLQYTVRERAGIRAFIVEKMKTLKPEIGMYAASGYLYDKNGSSMRLTLTPEGDIDTVFRANFPSERLYVRTPPSVAPEPVAPPTQTPSATPIWPVAESRVTGTVKQPIYVNTIEEALAL